jgi:predicted phosphoadenosine phosphosulfate sulfurtransferase
MNLFEDNKSMEYLEKNVYELAKDRVRRAYELFDTVTVMFSGGKDSTATLQVTLEVAEELGRTPVDVFFFDEEAIPMQTEEYVRRVGQDPRVNLHWLCLPIKARNACSRREPYWYPWDKRCPEKWVRPLPPEAITELPNLSTAAIMEFDHYDIQGALHPPDKYGTVGSCLGIRAQESLSRLRSVTAKRHENYIVKYAEATDMGNVWKIYPVYDWKHQDVWTAPDVFGWDYNHAYDVMDKAGISISLQRCSPAFGNEPLQKLWSYKTCFPEIWDKMSTRVEGANTAVRYALTSLYSYGGRPEKPADWTWTAFLSHFIKKYPKDVQKSLAKRIKSEIKAHTNKTSDPIMEFAPHPETGCSWNYLLMLAMRTDDKNRKQAGSVINTDKLDEHWEKYRAEVKEWRQKKKAGEIVE